MEKSPREQKLNDIYLKQEINQLLYTLESETSYPNPHAAARISIAGKKLLALSPSIICEFWDICDARSNAATLVMNSQNVMMKHQNTPMEFSAALLHKQSIDIFSAIKELNEKIEKMASCGS